MNCRPLIAVILIAADLTWSARPLSAADDFPGLCLEFDGVNDYVTHLDYFGETLAGEENQFTVTAWILAPAQDDGAIISQNTESGDDGFQLLIDSSGQICVYDPTFGCAINSDPIDDGHWHYIAYRRSGPMGDLFVDGNPEGWQVATFAFVAGDQWSFGQEWDGGSTSQHFEGELDEVQFWTRPLSTEELRTGMHSTRSGGESDLHTYWQLNDYYPCEYLTYADGSYAMGAYLMNINTCVGHNSSAPVGGGSSTLRHVIDMSSYSFTGTGAELSFSWISGPGDVVVTRLDRYPILWGSGEGEVIAPEYWIVHVFDFTFTADLTLSLGADVDADDEALPLRLRLNQRPVGGLYGFTSLGGATEADAAEDWAVFSDLSATGELFVKRNPQPLPVPEVQIEYQNEVVVLSWQATSPDDLSYTVYASQDPLATFPEGWTIAAFPVTETQWTDSTSDTLQMFYRVTSGFLVE